jgi:hypothetical protein
LLAARSRRPLELKFIAGKPGEIEVSLESKSVDGFSVFLVNRRERDQLVGGVGRQVRLLGKFTPCRRDEVLAGVDETFGDRPNAVVLFRPERTAGMRKQDFESVPAPAGEQSGTDFLTAAHRRRPR